MKKTLSVVLTSAMALSMFSSLAFAKTSADFTDLKDLDAATKAKFDAMITAGIFDGVTDTTFGLKDEMNRAQFAKVAALIMGLEVNKDLKTSTFTDVSVTDAANGYALPYIEALKTAGVTDGYAEGQYNPAGKVTKEQLATFLVRVLGQDEAAKGKTGTDTTVSGWAQGYVALALELKLLSNDTDGKFGGQANATRDLLLTGAYEAKQQYVPAGKVSVTGVKATGVQQVTVNFNKPVDTDKVKLAMTKGSIDVATTVKFADDKKSAVLTLTDVKVGEGDYKVTLSGLDAAAVDKTTATFKGENEKVTKLEFANAGDTVAKASDVRLKVKATNQYGENASLSTGSYTVYADAAANAQLSKSDSGELLLKLDTSTYASGTGLIAVNIYNNENRTTVSKTFKVGTAPFISKMELGALKYSNGKDAINAKGETATFDVMNYDQYGNVVAYTTADNTNTRVVFNGYEPALQYEVGDSNSDQITDVKIYLNNSIDKAADFNFTVYNQAGSATGTVKLVAGKVATKVEIGDVSNVVAAGDTEAFLPITAYDAAGNVLSTEDLVSNQNLGRIKISSSTDASGSDHSVLQTNGENKGKVRITNIPTTSKSVISVNAYIAEPNASSNDTATITVADARVPESFKVVTDPAKKIAVGGESAFQIKVYDQYGKELKNIQSTDGNGGIGTANNYRISVATNVTGGVAVVPAAGADFTAPITGTDAEFFNEEHKFTFTAAVAGTNSAEFVAKVEKQVGTGAWSELFNVTKKVEAITADTDLTYEIQTVSDLVNAIDTSSVAEATYDTASGDKLTVGTQESAVTSKLARQVKLTATDGAGNKVAIPQTISSITSSNGVVAKTDMDAGKGYVIGNEAGAATLNVAFTDNKGQSVLKTVNVKVLDNVVTSKEVVAGNTSRTTADWTAAVTKATNGTEGTDGKPNAFRLMNLKVTDNYGVTFEGFEAQQYNYLFGVVFTAKGITGTGSVSVDQYGNITADAGVTGFDLVATTATGMSVSTSVLK
ncbi:hypothetical protein GC102_05755 [Paenibacillus sp. LMG 31460]|uniref:SLH domain-containing protein n=1 Tax=Paenibacillus germinis TaxID=2654979 RepID=A0ABX1YW16_9BACL|nr:S-layer homology domain-containing protein [Paenibacillus germinis]NOU85288.1 hypothetical protein [Paenibacillus germinis]